MIEENGGGNRSAATTPRKPLITEVDRIVQRSPYRERPPAPRHDLRRLSAAVRPRPAVPDQRESGRSTRIAGGWEVAGMWLFNSGRPWGLPQNVFYVKDATIENVDYSDPTSSAAVQNCVAQMNDAGVVTMLGFSVAAGCTEPNFIIRPNYTPRTTAFRDDQIRRPPFYQFDVNFAKTTQHHRRRPRCSSGSRCSTC